MAATEQEVQRSETRWAVWVSLFVLIIFGLTVFAALALHRNPPSNLERIDPKTLHLTGEFTEPNLGTRVEQNGQVTTRIVATQFAVVPPCVVVPADREVTLRLASPDVIHGGLWLADRAIHRATVAGRDRPPPRPPGLAAMNRKWRLWGTLGVLAALAVGGLLGFIVMPVVQGRAAGIDAYTAICRAVGILPGSPARPTPPSQAVPQPVTQVAWTTSTFEELYHADRANGARLAEAQCVSCHTLEGNTPDPSIPRNIGQSVFALYKQLHDFRSGSRVNETMSPLVKDLDDKQIADLATYYGRLFRGAIDPDQSGLYVGADIENIVSNGDVARGLPPCSACHATRTGGPIETPTLTGQYAQYLEAQLKAFASGTRHNDIYHRMRSVAAKLTPDEIRLLAIRYSGQ